MSAELQIRLADDQLELLAELLANKLRQQQRAEQPATPRRMLTVPELVRTYGLGRGQLLKLIGEGQLPAVACTMRGGREGWRVRIEDAERVLAGA